MGQTDRLARQTVLSEGALSPQSLAGGGLGCRGHSSRAVVDPEWWQMEAVSQLRFLRQVSAKEMENVLTQYVITITSDL